MKKMLFVVISNLYLQRRDCLRIFGSMICAILAQPYYYPGVKTPK